MIWSPAVDDEHAVSAIIVVGGRPNIFNQERSIENINYYYNYRFATLILRPRPRTSWTGHPHDGSRWSINSTSLEWRAARPPWLRCFCQFLCVVADCRISLSSSYVEKWYKTAFRPSLTPLLFGPRRHAPYHVTTSDRSVRTPTFLKIDPRLRGVSG
jgi:hypothetical protein